MPNKDHYKLMVLPWNDPQFALFRCALEASYGVTRKVAIYLRVTTDKMAVVKFNSLLRMTISTYIVRGGMVAIATCHSSLTSRPPGNDDLIKSTVEVAAPSMRNETVRKIL